MKKRITLKKIANEFGVSIATVSKALNNSYEISTQTRKKIQKYAKEHNYKPNSLAISLLRKKSNSIGVIIPNIMNSFFTKVFVGIEKKATENGYNLISCISNESYEKEVKTMDLLMNGTLDGFILSIAEETQINQNYDHFKNAINDGVPIVMFDRVTDDIDCDKVIVNDEEGAFNATKHLFQTGCKKVALISTIDNLSVGKLRVEGYKKAVKKYLKDIDEKLIIRIGKNEDFTASMKIVLSDKKIDGLLCLEESSAIQCLEIVKGLKYKIPKEMSIICFTNGPLPHYVSPKITTISQHGKYLGEIATQMLIERIENEDESSLPYSTKIVKTSLIERETTRPLL